MSQYLKVKNSVNHLFNLFKNKTIIVYEKFHKNRQSQIIKKRIIFRKQSITIIKEISIINSKYLIINSLSNKSQLRILMKAKTSEFYGVPVQEYNIKPLKDIGLPKEQLQKICINNAHVYSHALQNGYNVPSDSRVEKTILKNTKGVEPIVNRLNRRMRKLKNYSAQLFGQAFRKNKLRLMKKPIPEVQAEKAYTVFSPEQIVIKCARQAFSRSLIQKQSVKIIDGEKKPQSIKQKRKIHQKQRRLERVLLMKTYKFILVGIFGQKIFGTGWKIGRSELKQAIGLPQEAYNIKLMQNIISHRQAVGRQRSIIFQAKRKVYLQQKFERKKQLKKLRNFYRNKYLKNNQVCKHEKEDHYQLKFLKKSSRNQTKLYGQLQKRKRKREFIKKRIYPQKQNNNVNRQILREIIDIQQDQSDSQNDYDQGCFQQEPLKLIK